MPTEPLERDRPAQAALPGIIGGAGPLAHLALERRLLAESARRGARADADHPVWILISATDIPDRTASLAAGDDRCARALVRHGRVLEAAGADFMVVACNTAHAFHASVQAELAIPWLHLIDLTAEAIARRGVTRVGVLATDGTLRAELYPRSLRRHGITVIAPEPDGALQRELMAAIYAPDWGIKASGAAITARATAVVERGVAWLHQHGAELVIAGCTEISCALEPLVTPVPWLDPLEVAAHTILDLASGRRPAPRKASR
jgi:aspartate racemase